MPRGGARRAATAFASVGPNMGIVGGVWLATGDGAALVAGDAGATWRAFSTSGERLPHAPRVAMRPESITSAPANANRSGDGHIAGHI